QKEEAARTVRHGGSMNGAGDGERLNVHGEGRGGGVVAGPAVILEVEADGGDADQRKLLEDRPSLLEVERGDRVVGRPAEGGEHGGGHGVGAAVGHAEAVLGDVVGVADLDDVATGDVAAVAGGVGVPGGGEAVGGEGARTILAFKGILLEQKETAQGERTAFPR